MARKRVFTESMIAAFLEHDKISDIMRATGLSRKSAQGSGYPKKRPEDAAVIDGLRERIESHYR